METLFLDIETAPNISYSWGLWSQNISLSQLIQPAYMLCFAAKWEKERKVHFYSIQKEKEMLNAAHQFLDRADVVVTWNGDRFDIPHLQRELLGWGFPPSPFKSLDLMKVVKKQFKFVSNKLEHIATELGLEGKVKHRGFSLWTDVLANDPKAWKEMERYSKRDVVLLEEIKELILPWISNHPSRILYDNEVCTNCTAGNLQRRGFLYKQSRKYQRFQCTNCGKWLSSTKSIDGVVVQ